MSNKSGKGDSPLGFRDDVYRNSVCGHLILIESEEHIVP
jgi:hypothetical protein